MAMTAAQYRDRIVKELNGGDLLAANIDQLWSDYDVWAASPRLQYLKTRLAAIEMLLGNLDEGYTGPVEGDRSQRESTRMTILFRLRDSTLTDLVQLGGGARGVARYVVGKLKTTTIIPPPPTALVDADNTLYQGDPYQPGRLPQVQPP